MKRIALLGVLSLMLVSCSRSESPRPAVIEKTLTAIALSATATPLPRPTPVVELGMLEISLDEFPPFEEYYRDAEPMQGLHREGALEEYGYVFNRILNDRYIRINLMRFDSRQAAVDNNSAIKAESESEKGRALSMEDTVSLTEDAWMMFLPDESSLLLGFSTGCAVAVIQYKLRWDEESRDAYRGILAGFAQEQYFKLYFAGFK